MFVILTSKPGEFRTECVEGLVPVERYEYLFCGRKRAEFVIARLEREAKVRIVEESEPALVNVVPTKFLPRFPTLEGARAQLAELAAGPEGTCSLQRREPA
ncbi:MAG: ferredoxin [Clostridia bacterium]